MNILLPESPMQRDNARSIAIARFAAASLLVFSLVPLAPFLLDQLSRALSWTAPQVKAVGVLSVESRYNPPCAARRGPCGNNWNHTAWVYDRRSGHALQPLSLVSDRPDEFAAAEPGQIAELVIRKDIFHREHLDHFRFRAAARTTPLIIAVAHDRTDAIASLIRRKADLEQRDELGWTALMWAAALCRRDAARLLIQNGADLDARDPQGWTAGMLSKARMSDVEMLAAGAPGCPGNSEFKLRKGE